MKKTTAFVAVAGLTVIVLGGCAASRPGATPVVRVQQAGVGAGPDPSSGIVAHGVGRISGTPNLLTINVGVQTTAAHAVDALGQNSQRAQAVIDSLKKNGVADKDIQTSQLNLSPHYTGPNTLSGYEVFNTVTAKLRTVSRAGAAIDAAVAAAGDDGRLQGVFFSFDDDSALKAQARHDAVVQAKAQAQQLADAAGVKLGALRSLAETSQGSPWPVPYAMGAKVAMGGAADSAPPVQAGTQELTVEVTTVYEVTP